MLYFIKTVDYYKIGYTDNLDERMKNYATHNPIAELLGIKEGDKNDEKSYHLSFCIYEGTGEWYKLPEDVVNEIIKDFTPSDALFHHNKRFVSKTKEYHREKSKNQKHRDRKAYYKERAKRPERIEYMKEYQKKYRENLTDEQREKQKEYQRKYREEHKEKLRLQQKEWREKNKAASI